MQCNNQYSRFYICSFILFFISLWLVTDTRLALAEDDSKDESLEKIELELKKVQLETEKINLLLKAGYEGKVDVGEGAGRADGMLLGTLAVNSIAEKFAASIDPLIGNGRVSLVLFSTENVPKFQLVDVFNAQYDHFRKWYDILSSGKKKIDFETAFATGAALLRYAKTDYSFYDIKINSDNRMLLSAFSYKLKAKYNVSVFTPEIYYVPDAKAIDDINRKIKDLREWSKEAKEKKWKDFSKSLDAWLKSLFADGSKKMSDVYLWSSMRERLNNTESYIIVTELYEIAGTAYTKKNLWSTLGANPFKVMGAAVASYTMYNANSGEVLSSMLLPVHGGYYSVSELEEHIKKKTE